MSIPVPSSSFRPRFPRTRALHVRSIVGGLALVLAGLVVAACSANGPGNASSEATAVPTTCGKGTDVCDPALCGWDCATPGQACAQKCFPEDHRAMAGVKLDVSGDVKSALAAPRPDFMPQEGVVSGTTYGCELAGLASAGTNLVVRYADWTQMGASPLRTFTTRFDMTVKKFAGPGKYGAAALFDSAGTSSASTAYEYDPGKDNCAVDIQDNAGDGVKGTFRCASIPNVIFGLPGSVTVEGNFACPATALGQHQEMGGMAAGGGGITPQ
jgi:hypothetical protein